MKLRTQLLFVSLITLTLPWAGFQFIHQMESTLKQAQVHSMEATAKAVAAYLGSSETLQPEIVKLSPAHNSNAIYIHKLAAPPIIDGYNEEWAELTLASQRLENPNSAIKLDFVAGEAQNQFFVFVRAYDKSIHYFNPSYPSPEFSDHLTLNLNGKTFLIFSGGPGTIQAAEVKNEKQLSPAYRIKGVWLETANGYQVELSFPKDWALTAFGITLSDSESKTTIANFSDSPPAPIFRAEKLEAALHIFQQAGLRMAISTTNSKLVATVGSVSQENRPIKHGFIPWFYKAVIGIPNLPDLDDPINTGLFDTPEISAALKESQAPSGWYRYRNQTLVRVAHPIRNQGVVMGAVVLDQNADSLETIASSAFYRLLFYSVIATTIGGGTLMIYASWLSWRIRKLSLATASAVSDTGKISDTFPILTSGDELGDLSRHYAGLLARLREYTNYLRTLSSKLSHELRTPLAIVRSSLDNIDQEPASEQVRTYVTRAQDGATRLSSILNAMSAASRVEQAISGAERENIPCNELLTNLKAAYEDAYPNVSFHLSIQENQENENWLCFASGELLVQMLDKLVDNAVDFSPAGGCVELKLHREQSNVVFSVSNEGPPLPTHMHGQLFDSLVSIRENNPVSAQHHHLGLGLYIVRLIVDFHQGSVHGYNTSNGKGVTFEVKLPTCTEQHAANNTPKKP